MPSGQASYADVVAILEPVFGNNRALRIAVTETTRIYAEATQIYANELVKEYPGFKVIKRWYTNVDDRVCPICAPLDGMEVAHDEDFNDVENPPAHVNCRCWITTTVKS
jgi:SPP1 gp7 family putative phage head morphogenesis protein